MYIYIQRILFFSEYKNLKKAITNCISFFYQSMVKFYYSNVRFNVHLLKLIQNAMHKFILQYVKQFAN